MACRQNRRLMRLDSGEETDDDGDERRWCTCGTCLRKERTMIDNSEEYDNPIELVAKSKETERRAMKSISLAQTRLSHYCLALDKQRMKARENLERLKVRIFLENYALLKEAGKYGRENFHRNVQNGTTTKSKGKQTVDGGLYARGAMRETIHEQDTRATNREIRSSPSSHGSSDTVGCNSEYLASKRWTMLREAVTSSRQHVSQESRKLPFGQGRQLCVSAPIWKMYQRNSPVCNTAVPSAKTGDIRKDVSECYEIKSMSLSEVQGKYYAKRIAKFFKGEKSG